jgi:hypothetical protein
MFSRPVLSQVVVAACLGLATPLLLVPPAHALPVFTESDLDMDNYRSSTGAACTFAANDVGEVTNQPLAENGAPTALTASQAGTLTSDGDPADQMSFATSASIMGTVTSTGANPRTILLAGSGSVSVTTSLPASTCELEAHSGAGLDFTFSVAQPGFLTFELESSRFGYVQVDLNSAGEELIELEDFRGRGEALLTVFLTPGVYDGFLEGGAEIVSTSVPISGTATFSGEGTFVLAGSQSAAPAGKAKRYVAFPLTRNCATDTVDLTVKSRKAKKISSIVFKLNGTTVKKVKKPKPGASVALPVAENLAADVVTRVKLKPKKKGVKPKVVEGSASYVACG